MSNAAQAQAQIHNTDVPLVESGAALQSMRNSDFDAYSAYGEVIDNSIQAEAKNIKIIFDYDHADRNREPLNCVAFADDGNGMGSEILHRCLQLGYSSRFNDRSGIGRFGVGATLAAINQCQRVELYSKQKGGLWLFTYVDLEEITAKKMVGIPDPIQKDPPAKFADIVSKENGTLVIWSKYDRQHDDATDIMEEFRVWSGRTYRKFIWKGLNLSINGEAVNAIDPLYVTKEKTAFPEDPIAYEYDTMEIDWPIPVEDRQPGKPTTSKIKVRMSLLPKEFRTVAGQGDSAEAKKRSINLNEGISIIRNDREVFYGHIPYWPKAAFEDIDRWWGCEISFDAILDRDFTVKNIKRGAVPVKELKQSIAERIAPTRKTAVETVRQDWKKETSDKNNTPSALITTTQHEGAEKVAKAAPTPVNQIDKGKDTDEETRKFVDNWLKDADEKTKAAWETKFKSQPFTIIQDAWKGSDFFEAAHLGGKSVLKYNTQHAFFSEINDIINRLQTVDNDSEDARRLKVLIDLLIMSFAKSEASFDANTTVSISSFMEQLKMSWGSFLTTYLKTYENEQK